MSKAVLVSLRNPSQIDSRDIEQRLTDFLASLSPSNLVPNCPKIISNGAGTWLGVFNPVNDTAVRECNAYVGWLADPRTEWWRIGTPAASGSHATFRTSPHAIEVLADYAASRPIWVAQTEEIFIASSSQRAIPWFLGSFQPNSQAISWMLSSGTLGPSGGWDRRAQRLGPGASLHLDRARWKTRRFEPAIEFRADPAPDAVHAQRLTDALESTLGHMKVDHERWVLPLSGGYDSRAILLMMRDRKAARTVTWGSIDALRRVGSDAWVARRLAAATGVSNRYYQTDPSHAPVDRIIDRYLVAGDGCTDGLWAYLDGFEIWRSFFEDKLIGVIRGDHGFGASPGKCSNTEQRIRQVVGMARWSDLAGVPSLASFGLAHLESQPVPHALERAPGESLVDWRDRLYQAFRIPAYIAAQSELKAPYVEVANPLLVRELLQLTRSQPEHLRRGKLLFRKIIAPHDVGIRYAVESALVKPHEFLATGAAKEWLSDQLTSTWLRGVFTGRFADHLLNATMNTQSTTPTTRRLYSRARRFARWLVPPGLRANLPRSATSNALPLSIAALRACIASHMLERLARDARSGGRSVQSQTGRQQIRHYVQQRQ